MTPYVTMTPRALPLGIRAALEASAWAVPGPHGVHYGHDDDGDPWASIGPLAGGVEAWDVRDDFVVCMAGDRAVLLSAVGETLGTYADGAGFLAGLQGAMAALDSTRS